MVPVATIVELATSGQTCSDERGAAYVGNSHKVIARMATKAEREAVVQWDFIPYFLNPSRQASCGNALLVEVSQLGTE